MKVVTILLTKYSDLFGKFIGAISKEGYSHASLSIDENEEIFYSFNYKGFAIETPKKKRERSRKEGSVCIRMEVPDSTFQMIKEEIEYFLANKEDYRYCFRGVALCLLHIPFKFKNQYFCSQFVAEILAKAGAVELKKRETLYLPNHLLDGIECLFSQKQIVYNVI